MIENNRHDERCPNYGKFVDDHSWTVPDWEAPFSYPFRGYCNEQCDNAYAAKYPKEVAEWKRVEGVAA